MKMKEFERIVRQVVLIAVEHIEDGYRDRDLEQVIIDYFHYRGINANFSVYPDRKMVRHVFTVAHQIHEDGISQQEAYTRLGKLLKMKLV